MADFGLQFLNGFGYDATTNVDVEDLENKNSFSSDFFSSDFNNADSDANFIVEDNIVEKNIVSEQPELHTTDDYITKNDNLNSNDKTVYLSNRDIFMIGAGIIAALLIRNLAK